jgi:beta-phosphoglucomutase
VARTTIAILDFDGVIADSMPQHLDAYRLVLEPYDIQVDKMDVYLREGARSESIIKALLGDRDEAKDEALIKHLANKKQRTYQELGEISLYPQAERFVRGIREAAKGLGLVTGTRRENLDRWAGQLMPLFDAVLAQDAYENDKPHPEPYQKAVSALGEDAGSCLVVENAPRGVESAKAAGVGLVIAIATTLPREHLEPAGPDIVVQDHDEALKAALEALS